MAAAILDRTTPTQPSSHPAARSLSGWGLRSLFAASGWLTVTGLLMLADVGISLLGLVVDPTVITGAPAWLKPLKFAVSTGLFCLTVAWMIGRLSRTRRFAQILGRFLAGALTVEIVLIDMQAARHTTSHFNFSTRFDAYVFLAMGIGISILFLATTLLFLATCLEKFPDRALGWSIRLGLALALAGMGVGSLMTLPTPEQRAAAQATHERATRVGAHTVGAPDGGPSMPVTGWSADHGDLRIAHFLGLHAMQAMLAAWWLVSRRDAPARSRQSSWIFLAAASWTIAFAIVLAQALRGQPLLRPDAGILEAWTLWLVLTASGAVWLARVGRIKQSIPVEENAQ